MCTIYDQRRINQTRQQNKKMAEDIENQVIQIVQKSPFNLIQLIETTDKSNKALLLCFVSDECEGE